MSPDDPNPSASTLGQRREKPSLGIKVPTFNPAGLLRSFSIVKNSPVRRKALPPSANITPTSPSSRSISDPALKAPVPLNTTIVTPKSRSFTISTPGRTPLDYQFLPRDLDTNPHGDTPPPTVILPPLTNQLPSPLRLNPTNKYKPTISNSNLAQISYDLHGSRNETSISLSARPSSREQGTSNSYIVLPNMSTQAPPPRKSSRARPLHIDITTDDGSEPQPVPTQQSNIPKSPGLVLQNFFGWKSKDDAGAGSHNSSPSVSPRNEKSQPPLGPAPLLRSAKTMPMALDIPKANSSTFSFFGNAMGGAAPALPTPPDSNSQITELENELREISQELAISIKREMELEDEVDRLRAMAQEQPPDSARRTSDYFSDSGSSSVRYGPGEEAQRIEDLEKSKRKTELEKAQMKLEMSGRMAEVLKQRRLAEDRVLVLEEHVQTQSRNISPSVEYPDRVRYLESILEDLKRKLDEEKRNRDNMEELIGGMRHEIQQYKSERDNLKDEIVPQLESKLTSLEMFVSDGSVFQQPDRGVNFITEDEISPLPHSSIPLGLSRSKSSAGRWGGATRSRSNSNAAQGPGQRSRSGSVTYANESREQLIERAKDLEAQREALHKALRQLLDRHRWQEKQYSRKIKFFENDRNKQMTMTPRRTAFHREVKGLREEIFDLRKRADGALDQKWMTEKGLASLRIDLDRAREETTAMRALLREHDISIPNTPIRTSATLFNTEVQHESLDKAYEELRTTHALSIAHLQDLSSPEQNHYGTNLESTNILELLRKSLSAAEHERDAAHSAADKYRIQARQLQQSELQSLSRQKDLSADLFAAAKRMDDLGEQVKKQLAANGALRDRLANAIVRGEKDQHTSESRVAELQGKLRALEDRLVRAQQMSEDAIAEHDDEVTRLRAADNSQLQRSNISRTSAALHPLASGQSSNSPGSPMLLGLKSPRLTSMGMQTKGLPETSGRKQLEDRVKDLERALTEAEDEMGEVVSRMNKAQIEVAELQAERDEAGQQSRRLQLEVVQEREKVRVLMAKA